MSAVLRPGSTVRRRLSVGALGLVLAALVGWLWRGAGDDSRRAGEGRPAAPERAPEATLESAALARAERIEEARSAAADSGLESVRVFVRGGGRPIAGACVRCLGDLPRGWSALTATTDEAGTCELPLGYRPVLALEVTAPGFVGRGEELAWRERVELELLAGAPLEGLVLDEKSLRPIEGAEVHVRRRWPWTPLAEEARTDASGRFRLACAPRGEQAWITVQADGRSEERARPESTDEGEALVVELGLGRVLELELVGFPSGRPLANARVGDSCTDARGRVNVGAWTTAESLELELTAPGFVGLHLSLPPSPAADRASMRLRLPELARFFGVVRDASGAPVAGAELAFLPAADSAETALQALPSLAPGQEYDLFDEARESRAVTDSRGRYASEPLVPGARYVVRAVHPEAGDVLTDAVLGGPGELTAFDVTLVPRPVGALEGRVTFNGKWLPGSISWSHGRRGGSAELGLEGEFRFDEVDAGPVELAVQSSWLDPLADFLPSLRASVSVEAGGTTRRDFALELAYADIGGRVTDASGAPVEGARLTLSHLDPRYTGDDRTGSDGTWRESVPDLGWEFAVELAHGSEPLRVDGVRAGNLRVDFVLPTLVELPVRVVDAESGAPLEAWRLYWRRSGEARFRLGKVGRVSAGTTRLSLPPGQLDFLVQASEHGYRSARADGIRLELSRAPEPLEFRLERGLVLQLELAGDPLPRGALLLLVEEEAWPEVRASEQPSEWTFVRFNDAYVDGGSLYPGPAIFARQVAFDDERRATLQGLAPGRWRFKVLPDDVRLEPERLELPRAEPLVLRWRRP
jgi:hypothetical protein